MKLSAKQERAKRALGHARIIAGPGSGKTTLLVERCRHLMEDPAIKVCLVTFARMAAQEIRERLSTVVDTERITVSTFDALARTQVIHAIGNRRPPRPFEHLQILKKTIRRLELEIEDNEAEAIIARLGAKVNPRAESTPEEYELFTTYHRFLNDDSLIDFAAIAHMAINHLNSGRCEPLAVDHILVDEFQDTSPVQLEWLRHHWEAGIKVTIVGDDDQSIYGFRNAMGYQAMEIFSHCTDAEDFYLDECYRCGPEIIAHANQVIQYNYERIDKRITSKTAPGAQVRYWFFEDQSAEIKAMTEFLDQVLANGGERTMAVLARNNFVLNRIESELRCKNVKLRRMGGTSIWDRPAGGVMLNLAEMVTRPSRELAGTLLNVLRWAGVAEKYLAPYSESIAREGLLCDPCNKASDNDTIKQFADDLNTWCAMNESGHSEMVVTCLQDWVASHSKFSGDTTVAKLAAKSLMPGAGTLAQRLNQIKQSRPDASHSNSSTVLDLATFHGAKGLEWESVWITEAKEGVIPSKPTLVKESLGDVTALEEERRLYYVALTRAKRALVIAVSEDSPSRFNAEAGIQLKANPICAEDSPWATASSGADTPAPNSIQSKEPHPSQGNTCQL